MAMRIRVKDRATADRVFRAVVNALQRSRFVVDSVVVRWLGPTDQSKCEVVIGCADGSYASGILLAKAKHYCGNHPGPCPVIPGHKKRHVKARFLEGLDWVAFNDMINDVLDKLEVEATAGTALVNIRRGRKRRCQYDSHFIGVDQRFQEWDRVGNDTHYCDYCGAKAPRSWCPPGTPGLPHWRTRRVRVTA